MPPDDRRARTQERTWPAEFLLYTSPLDGEFKRISSASTKVPEHRVNEAVAQALAWMRSNRSACPPDAYLRVKVNGEIYFDSATRLLW
jgi:hypothetical protein